MACRSAHGDDGNRGELGDAVGLVGARLTQEVWGGTRSTAVKLPSVIEEVCQTVGRLYAFSLGCRSAAVLGSYNGASC